MSRDPRYFVFMSFAADPQLAGVLDYLLSPGGSDVSDDGLFVMDWPLGERGSADHRFDLLKRMALKTKFSPFVHVSVFDTHFNRPVKNFSLGKRPA